MKLVNLTPHAILIVDDAGATLEVPPAGTPARLDATYRPRAALAVTVVNDGDGGEHELPDDVVVPTAYVEFGEVSGLPAGPDPDGRTYYIVSMPVASHVRRPDVLSPGELVRDESGRPIGCRGLTRWAAAHPG